MPSSRSSSMVRDPNTKLILKSSSGYLFDVDEEVSSQSQTIKHMMQEDASNNGILLPNIAGKTLAKVIEYCEKQVEARRTGNVEDGIIKEWESKFVKVDHCTHFDLILAANELQLKHLLDLTTGTLGNLIQGKTVEEIRKMFNITSDYSPE